MPTCAWSTPSLHTSNYCTNGSQVSNNRCSFCLVKCQFLCGILAICLARSDVSKQTQFASECAKCRIIGKLALYYLLNATVYDFELAEYNELKLTLKLYASQSPSKELHMRSLTLPKDMFRSAFFLLIAMVVLILSPPCAMRKFPHKGILLGRRALIVFRLACVTS
jgi:hypothetical protein